MLWQVNCRNRFIDLWYRVHNAVQLFQRRARRLHGVIKLRQLLYRVEQVGKK